jgi:type IV pilus assembly protein PilN
MSSIRINLLPHREQKRQARQRQFITLMVSLAVLGLAVIALVHGILARRSRARSRATVAAGNQARRTDQGNHRLRDQIQAVPARSRWWKRRRETACISTSYAPAARRHLPSHP